MQYCCICKIKVLVLSDKPNLLVMRKILIMAAAMIIAAGCKGPGEQKADKVVMADSNAEIRIDEPVGNSEAKSMNVVLQAAPRKVAQVKFPQMEVADDYGDQASRTGKPNAVQKKIIKEGEIHFKTADINDTRKALYASLKKLGGYVAEESENNDSESGQKEITLQTRIPAKNFDFFVGDVSENAESIDSKNIRIRDVTTQFIDVTTQLANKKKLEERYLELLKRGSKISDLLEIENKLTEIRSDIESTQGQLNYMMRQVEYSSLDITFYARQTVKDNGQSFSYKIKASFLSGWAVIVNLFFGLVGFWPFWLVLALFVFIMRRWKRNRDNKIQP
jgi:hypothetical protein